MYTLRNSLVSRLDEDDKEGLDLELKLIIRV